MAFDLDFFKKRLSLFGSYYKPAKLMGKVKKYGRKAGVNVAHAVLVLYYASLDKDIPLKDRMMIYAALGYFILPADLLSDALPLGFTDDMAAITYVLRLVWGNLSPAVFSKARQKVELWFGPVRDDEILLHS